MPDESPRPPWEPWITRAREDISIAQTLLDAVSPAWAVCYHVQQAIEKGLKAILVSAGADPPKTHNLVRLNGALDPPIVDDSDEDQLAALTLWSIEQRYPADQPEPTTAEAHEALTFGARTIAAIDARLAGWSSRPDASAEDQDSEVTGNAE